VGLLLRGAGPVHAGGFFFGLRPTLWSETLRILNRPRVHSRVGLIKPARLGPALPEHGGCRAAPDHRSLASFRRPPSRTASLTFALKRTIGLKQETDGGLALALHATHSGADLDARPLAPYEKAAPPRGGSAAMLSVLEPEFTWYLSSFRRLVLPWLSLPCASSSSWHLRSLGRRPSRLAVQPGQWSGQRQPTCFP